MTQRTPYKNFVTQKMTYTRLPFVRWVRCRLFGKLVWYALFRGRQTDLLIPVWCFSQVTLAQLGQPEDV